MALVRTIIADALTEIGVLAESESPSAAMEQFALRRFQQQLDSWAAESLTLASLGRTTFTLASGTNTYTIGPGGTGPLWIDAQRPVWITRINYIIPGSSPAVESPGGLGSMDDESYAALSIKGLTSALPQQFYYNASTPLGTLFFWPTVTQDVEMVIYTPQAIDAAVTPLTDLTGPPGYQEAFMYQLAKRLCTPFGRTMPAELAQNVSEATARMKRPNNKPGLLSIDTALVPTFGGYNVLTDTSNQSGR